MRVGKVYFEPDHVVGGAGNDCGGFKAFLPPDFASAATPYFLYEAPITMWAIAGVAIFPLPKGEHAVQPLTFSHAGVDDAKKRDGFVGAEIEHSRFIDTSMDLTEAWMEAAIREAQGLLEPYLKKPSALARATISGTWRDAEAMNETFGKATSQGYSVRPDSKLRVARKHILAFFLHPTWCGKEMSLKECVGDLEAHGFESNEDDLRKLLTRAGLPTPRRSQ